MRLIHLVLPSLMLALLPPASAAELATAPVREVRGDTRYSAEAVVEAVRQSVLSAQVAGRVTQLAVKAGDTVSKGQQLARIDAQTASLQASASQAQVEAAKAQLDVARKEFERQQQLFRQQYISRAALDQAEAQFKATEASVRGSLAQAGAANTQTGFFTIAAPFAGRVSEVAAEQGDMAMPGKQLLTVYDPSEMRVVASLPQSRLAQLKPDEEVLIDLPGLPAAQSRIKASSVRVLPTVDPATHTVQVRLGLPAGLAALPGMFARASFSLQGSEGSRLLVPVQAVFRRTELDAVYVVTDGRALLRQVRLGQREGRDIEVLAGLRAGERVALDPVAAARR